MKKVNKQCLLDTPAQLESVKNLASYNSKQQNLVLKKNISEETVQTKIINSFMHMFNMSTLYLQSIKLLHQKLW